MWYVAASAPLLASTRLFATVPEDSPSRQYERGPRSSTVLAYRDADWYVYPEHAVLDVGGHTLVSWSPV